MAEEQRCVTLMLNVQGADDARRAMKEMSDAASQMIEAHRAQLAEMTQQIRALQAEMRALRS